jgi:hypothetical protein
VHWEWRVKSFVLGTINHQCVHVTTGTRQSLSGEEKWKACLDAGALRRELHEQICPALLVWLATRTARASLLRCCSDLVMRYNMCLDSSIYAKTKIH